MVFTTGELYEILPMVVRHDGDMYFLSIHKISKGTVTEYKTNEGKYLFDTSRRGKTLRSSIIRMLKLLIDNDFIKNDPIKYMMDEDKLIDVNKI